MAESRIVYSEAGKNGGAPVFLDTDVPVLNLPQYLESGNTTLNVYTSRYAGTNKATAVTWTVGDKIEETVRALKAKGVTFEHYDMPGMKVEGDIHIGGDMKVAWFKDPDGNILNVVSR